MLTAVDRKERREAFCSHVKTSTALARSKAADLPNEIAVMMDKRTELQAAVYRAVKVQVSRPMTRSVHVVLRNVALVLSGTSGPKLYLYLLRKSAIQVGHLGSREGGAYRPLTRPSRSGSRSSALKVGGNAWHAPRLDALLLLRLRDLPCLGLGSGPLLRRCRCGHSLWILYVAWYCRGKWPYVWTCRWGPTVHCKKPRSVTLYQAGRERLRRRGVATTIPHHVMHTRKLLGTLILGHNGVV